MAYWRRALLQHASVHAVEREEPSRDRLPARQAAFQRELFAGDSDLLPLPPQGAVADAERLSCAVSSGPLAGLQLVLAWRHPRLCLSLTTPDPALQRRLRQHREGLLTALEQGLGVSVELLVAGESGD